MAYGVGAFFNKKFLEVRTTKPFFNPLVGGTYTRLLCRDLFPGILPHWVHY
jgi:hypothetical protein